MIDKQKVLDILKYSSKWNDPCPDWVFKAIAAMDDETPGERSDTPVNCETCIHSVPYKDADCPYVACLQEGLSVRKDAKEDCWSEDCWSKK